MQQVTLQQHFASIVSNESTMALVRQYLRKESQGVFGDWSWNQDYAESVHRPPIERFRDWGTELGQDWQAFSDTDRRNLWRALRQYVKTGEHPIKLVSTNPFGTLAAETTQPQNLEISIMQQLVKKQTLVLGQDITSLNAEQLVGVIKRLEQEKKDLAEITTKSEFLNKRVAEVDSAIAEVVAQLDAGLK